MSIIFFGFNKWGASTLQYLISNGYFIPIVVVRDFNNNKCMYIKDVINSNNCNSLILGVENYGWNKISEEITKHKPILGISCSFGDIIPENIFAIPELGVINIHGGKLPEMRGCNELNWALVKGHKEHEVTLHQVDMDFDTGNIFSSRKFKIYNSDNINTLKKRMFKETNNLLNLTLHKILCRQIEGKKQNNENAYYYRKRNPEDGKIDWSLNAIDIYNLIRALIDPYPGAFCYYKNNKIVIEDAEVIITNKVYKSFGKVVYKSDTVIQVLTQYNRLKIKKLRNVSINEIYINKGDYLE